MDPQRQLGPRGKDRPIAPASGAVVRKGAQQTQEPEHGEPVSERHQRIGPRLLSMLNQGRAAGNEESGEPRQQQRPSGGPKPLQHVRRSDDDGDGRCAEQDRGKTKRKSARAEQSAPQLERRIIEWRVGLVGRHHGPQLVPAPAGEPSAIGFVEPERAERDPDQPHGQREQCQPDRQAQRRLRAAPTRSPGADTRKADAAFMLRLALRPRWLTPCNPGPSAWTIRPRPARTRAVRARRALTMGVEAAPAVERRTASRPWWESRWCLALVVLATMLPLAYPPGAAVGRPARPYGPLPGRARARPFAVAAAHITITIGRRSAISASTCWSFPWARSSGLELAVKLIVLADPAADRRGLPVGRATRCMGACRRPPSSRCRSSTATRSCSAS